MKLLDKLFNNYIELSINSSYEIKTPENASNVYIELPEYNAPEYIHNILTGSHVLVGGCSGAGKSTLLNALLYYAYLKDNTEFILIDNKGTEYKPYKNNKKTLCYCDNNDVMNALSLACDIIQTRYNLIKNNPFEREYKGSRVYIVIDELAVLLKSVNKKTILEKLIYISQIGRAANVILIGATQNVTKKLLDAIKDNFDVFIGLRTSSESNSRLIIGSPECYSLPRYGKCIVFMNGYRTTENVQKISDKDIYYINQ